MILCYLYNLLILNVMFLSVILFITCLEDDCSFDLQRYIWFSLYAKFLFLFLQLVTTKTKYCDMSCMAMQNMSHLSVFG